MSYEKVKSISINKKKNTIFITSASNNVYPKYYNKWEYIKGASKFDKIGIFEEREFSFEEKMKSLLCDIAYGNLSIYASMYNWNYAITRANEDMGYLRDLIDYKYSIYGFKEDSYYGDRLKIITENDLKDGNYNLLSKYDNVYYKEEERQEDLKRIKNDIDNYYIVFMKYFEEKDTEKIFTLYSEDSGYIKVNCKGSYKYGASWVLEKGTYKEMYYKRYVLNNGFYTNRVNNVEIKRVLESEKEIKEKLEQEELREKAKERIKDKELVKKDLTDYKNGVKNFDRYYFEELCKMFGIDYLIPKGIYEIGLYTYRIKGKSKINYKTRGKFERTRKELQNIEIGGI